MHTAIPVCPESGSSVYFDTLYLMSGFYTPHLSHALDVVFLGSQTRVLCNKHVIHLTYVLCVKRDNGE